MNLVTLKWDVRVVQQYNGLRLELKRFHRAARELQEFGIASFNPTAAATTIHRLRTSLIISLQIEMAGTTVWLGGGRWKVANHVLDVSLCESSVGG